LTDESVVRHDWKSPIWTLQEDDDPANIVVSVEHGHVTNTLLFHHVVGNGELVVPPDGDYLGAHYVAYFEFLERHFRCLSAIPVRSN
jgi:hypothetical protein